VAAVHAAEDDADPIGAAVAIDDSRVLTCAHVVISAEGVVREPLWVSFPKADGWPRRRVAAVTVAYSPPVRDLAVLVLQGPTPADVDAAPLRCPRSADLAGRAWWAFGFPGRDPVGDAAVGVVGAALALGWVRLDTSSRDLLEPGFSGGGVWGPAFQGGVGGGGRGGGGRGGRGGPLGAGGPCVPRPRPGVLAGWWAG